MRFIFVYKGIYVGILLINFYIYNFVKGGSYPALPGVQALPGTMDSQTFQHYVWLTNTILQIHIVYFAWNAFNFSRIWQKKVTVYVLISEMLICIGKMLMLPLGAFGYQIISPSGWVYLSISGKLHFIFYPIAVVTKTAPILPMMVIIIIIEAIYFRCLWRYKKELASKVKGKEVKSIPTT